VNIPVNHLVLIKERYYPFSHKIRPTGKGEISGSYPVSAYKTGRAVRFFSRSRKKKRAFPLPAAGTTIS
jgi:hypothetical protein